MFNDIKDKIEEITQSIPEKDKAIIQKLEAKINAMLLENENKEYSFDPSQYFKNIEKIKNTFTNNLDFTNVTVKHKTVILSTQALNEPINIHYQIGDSREELEKSIEFNFECKMSIQFDKKRNDENFHFSHISFYDEYYRDTNDSCLINVYPDGYVYDYNDVVVAFENLDILAFLFNKMESNQIKEAENMIKLIYDIDINIYPITRNIVSSLSDFDELFNKKELVLKNKI